LIDEDDDLWCLCWFGIDCINDRDDNVSISLNVLVLMCVANTVWLRDGKFEQPKGGNSECRSLHFEMTDGDLNGRFYGREHVIFALIIFVVRRDAAKTAKFVQRMRLESRAKECVDGSQSLTRNENGLFVGREDVRIEE